jgi:hypothetical protein
VIVRLLRAFGLNVVPLGGVIAGWSTSTALALYWFETLLALPLVLARVVLHRRATAARGHFRAHFASGAENGNKPGSLLAETALFGTVFTLAHGLFLVVFLVVILPRQDPAAAIDPRQLGGGLLVVMGLLALSFLRDLVGLGERPFAWVKQEAQSLLGRTAVVHLAIIGGVWLGAVTGRPTLFVLAFGVLKLWTDLASAWPRRRGASSEPPKALAAVLDHLPAGTGGPKGSFREFYRVERERELALIQADELPR